MAVIDARDRFGPKRVCKICDRVIGSYQETAIARVDGKLVVIHKSCKTESRGG